MPQLAGNKSRWVARVNLAGPRLQDQDIFIGASKTENETKAGHKGVLRFLQRGHPLGRLGAGAQDQRESNSSAPEA